MQLAAQKRNLLFSLLIVFVSTISLTVANDQLPELEIHNTFKPESCERKAAPTDVITLHYKGTLQDGKVFDSR